MGQYLMILNSIPLLRLLVRTPIGLKLVCSFFFFSLFLFNCILYNRLVFLLALEGDFGFLLVFTFDLSANLFEDKRLFMVCWFSLSLLLSKFDWLSTLVLLLLIVLVGLVLLLIEDFLDRWWFLVRFSILRASIWLLLLLLLLLAACWIDM